MRWHAEDERPFVVFATKEEQRFAKAIVEDLKYLNKQVDTLIKVFAVWMVLTSAALVGTTAVCFYLLDKLPTA